MSVDQELAREMVPAQITYEDDGAHVEEAPRYRYDLSDAELLAVEGDVYRALWAAGVDTPVAAVLVPSSHPAANFGRTYEQRVFDEAGEKYDFSLGMGPYERESCFLYTVDVEKHVIAHAKRLVMPRTQEQIDDTGLTGLEMVDDRLTATIPEEAAALEELLEASGIGDIQRSFNVATNQTTNRAALSLQRPYALLSYKAVFQLARDRGVEQLLAYLNQKAIRSLGKLGIESELLGGRSYHLPLPAEPGTYNDSYQAFYIPASPNNISAFTDVHSDNRFTQLVANQPVPIITLV
jgi:hypothetical protein